MPERNTRSTHESNFRIEKTTNGTYLVRSDSERFGKDEITYQSPKRLDCLNYIAQRRPERQIRYYVIPDLMSWSQPRLFEVQTPIEHFDSLQEAVARFQELFPQDYNAEITDRNSVGLSYARLTLGVEWTEEGKHGAVDLIHVRKGKADYATHEDAKKDLCGDFTRMDGFNTDRRLLSALRQLEHEIGIDRVVLYHDEKVATVPYSLWENDYFEPIGYTEAIFEAPSQWSYVIVTLQPDYTVDYEIYDNDTAELKDSGRLLRRDFISMEDAARAALGQPNLNLTRCEMTVRDTLLEAHEEFPQKRAEPVYLKTWEQAVQQGEQKLYSKSRSLNEEFLSDMTGEISRTYNGRSFDGSVSRFLLAKYGAQRSSALLANVIQHRLWEGRFSVANRQWAQSVPVPHDRAWDRLSQCDTHPGLLNELTTDVRQEIRAQQQERKQPSRLTDRLEAAKEAAQQRSTAQQPTRTRTHKNDLQL